MFIMGRRKSFIKFGIYFFLAYSMPTLACDQKAADDGDLGAMIDCAQEPYDKADKELNDFYKKITDSLKSSKKDTELKQLKADQRQWIKKKERDCKTYFNRNESGAEGPISGFPCLQGHTEKRLAELKQKFK
jgi:uncharacterized protein YecT (DUF1311 family)